jgi:thiol-disulfide isomerase/thioredoxin
MTDRNDVPASPPGGGWKGAVAIALLAAGAALLYVKAGPSGKKETREASAACAAAVKTAESLGPLAKGEVAAMTVAKAPEAMAEISFLGPDGGPRTLANFKGKTVLLNLWATWCVPCRQEMPALDRLQKIAGSDKFEVVAINIDTSRLDRPKAFLQEIGVKNLTYYSDPKADVFFQMKQSGKVLGLPTTFLIDPAGCQLGLMSGPAQWDSADAQALVAKAASVAP